MLPDSHLFHVYLQGIHGEALLCKSFYSLRNSFQCGAKVIQEHCESHVFEDLNRIQQQVRFIYTNIFRRFKIVFYQ